MKRRIYKLTPHVCDKLWGGYRLERYGKGRSRIAETRELSFTKGSETHIDGRPISEVLSAEELGENCRRFGDFPVLTKFIDAAEKLSVQVHPSDEYAAGFEGTLGKSELWYVVEADAGAGLYLGLKEKTSTEEFLSCVERGEAEGLLDFKPVSAGDVYFIPPGTIHVIGPGTVIFEIQENSELTYRIYDYMRRDADGNMRELHLEDAMRVARLGAYEVPPRVEKNGEILGKCDYFEVRKCKVEFTKTPLFAGKDSFVSVTCVFGCGSIEGQTLSLGDTYLVPAGYGEYFIEGDLTAILVSVPKKDAQDE